MPANVTDVAPDFRLPDALWQRFQPLLPTLPAQPRGGRPRRPWRSVLDGIFYVMRTGCQWKAVPPQFGSGSTLHRYFQLLVEAGVFERLWEAALAEYDDLVGLEWRWQSLDGCITKSPLGGEKDGQQPGRSGQTGDQTEPADRRTWHPGRARRRRGERARHAAGRRDDRTLQGQAPRG